MLLSLNKLRKFSIRALDGEIGSISEFFFDENDWNVRYIVVETGSWLFRKQVLISPKHFAGVDVANEQVKLALTREQIENSPDVDTDRPVSRNWEMSFYDYYSLPYYWVQPGLGTMGAYPVGGANPFSDTAQGVYPPTPDARTENPEAVAPEAFKGHATTGDRFLRSTKEVTNYGIHAKDGSFGHMEDFLVDEDDFRVRYFVIDTKNWLPGKKVLLSPLWVTSISWEDREVYTDLDQHTIKNGPSFDSDSVITRELETELHSFYKKEPYWDRGIIGGKPSTTDTEKRV